MKKVFVIVTILSLISIACKRKEDTNWDIDVNAPLIKTTLSVSDILKDNVIENPDSTINLVFNYNLNTVNTDSLFKIPDTTVKTAYTIPFGTSVTLNPGLQLVNDPTSNSFNYGDARITEMKIKTGKIKYKITNNIKEKTIYHYKILNSNDGNGNAFETEVTVPEKVNSTPGVLEGEISIDGYSFDMTGLNGNSFNTLETVITVTINPNGNPVLVQNTDSVIIENSITELSPEYVKGYLGKTNFEQSLTDVDFDFFNQITNGSIDLDEVNIDLTTKNYVGADAQLKITQFKSLNTRTNNTISLSHAIVNNWININRAHLNNDVITPTINQYSLNKLNSNIDLFIENLPNKLQYEFEAKLNPLGNISAGNDFLFAKNTIDIDFNINIPLNLIANNLTLVDTVNLNINPDKNGINSSVFTLIANNGFPFDANIQVYILNNSNSIIDSLFTTGLISSAQTDINNYVTSSTQTKLESVISKEKMDLLNTNPKTIIKATFNTNGAGHTQIYKHYKLDLVLVADMNYTVNVK